MSGFDGNKRESTGTITLKTGYRPYMLHIGPQAYSASNNIFYWGGINFNTGTFYYEHNLTNTNTFITVTIIFVKQ